MSPATVYVYPLWEQNLRDFGPSIVVLLALAVYILSSRRWVAVLYWVIVALFLYEHAYVAFNHGAREAFVPNVPDGSVFSPRWGWSFAATLLADVVIVLALSAPLWRRWLRRRAASRAGGERLTTDDSGGRVK